MKVKCIYCQSEVKEEVDPKTLDEDYGWEIEALQHHKDCPWIFHYGRMPSNFQNELKSNLPDQL